MCVPDQPAAGVLQSDPDSAARRRQRARRPAAATARCRLLDRLRQFGFIILYALMLTGHAGRDHRAADPILPRGSCCRETARRLGHAPDRKAAPRASRRRARQLGVAAGAVRLLLLRRRLARADQRLRRHVRASSPTPTTWWPTGLPPASIPERSTLFVQSLVPEHAELYLLLSMTIPMPWLERVPTYKEQIEQLVGEGPVDARLPGLSAAADRGHHHLQRALRAGRRGSGAAPGAAAARSCAASTTSTASCSSSRSRC